MALITWTDKTDATVSGLPESKKVTAATTAEIKSVVNTNRTDHDALRTEFDSLSEIAGFVPFSFEYDNTTTIADPGVGKFRLNNTAWNSTLYLAISATDFSGRDISSVLNLLVTGSYIYIQVRSETNESTLLSVSSITDNTSWYEFVVSTSSGYAGLVGDKSIVGLAFLPFYAGGGGGGEANTTSNSGAGEGLALAKTGVNLPFKTLTTDTGLAYVSSATELKINVKEEYINGDRETNAAATGSVSLRWDRYKVFEYTLTGNTTLTDSNLPTGTDTKVIELVVDGNFTLTLPTYWEALPSNDTYDGTKRNHLVVSCINGTASSEDVIYSLQTLTT